MSSTRRAASTKRSAARSSYRTRRPRCNARHCWVNIPLRYWRRCAGLRRGTSRGYENRGWCEGPAMKQRSVGRSGLRVSQVGLGCNNLGQRIDFAASQAVVHKALDAGITLFDTADTYRVPTAGSEEYLGQILGARRKDIVLATKFGNPMDKEGVKRGASRRYIMSAVEDSLRRLGTDWIDLLQ